MAHKLILAAMIGLGTCSASALGCPSLDAGCNCPSRQGTQGHKPPLGSGERRPQGRDRKAQGYSQSGGNCPELRPAQAVARPQAPAKVWYSSATVKIGMKIADVEGFNVAGDIALEGGLIHLRSETVDGKVFLGPNGNEPHTLLVVTVDKNGVIIAKGTEPSPF